MSWADTLPPWYRENPYGRDYGSEGVRQGVAISQQNLAEQEFAWRKAYQQQVRDLEVKKFQLDSKATLDGLRFKQLDYDLRYQKMSNWMDSSATASGWMGLTDEQKMATPPPVVTDPNVSRQLSIDHAGAIKRVNDLREQKIREEQRSRDLDRRESELGLKTEVAQLRNDVERAKLDLGNRKADTEQQMAGIKAEYVKLREQRVTEQGQHERRTELFNNMEFLRRLMSEETTENAKAPLRKKIVELQKEYDSLGQGASAQPAAPAAKPATVNGSQYAEGTELRSKRDGKIYVVRNGVPVLKEGQ